MSLAFLTLDMMLICILATKHMWSKAETASNHLDTAVHLLFGLVFSPLVALW